MFYPQWNKNLDYIKTSYENGYMAIKKQIIDNEIIPMEYIEDYETAQELLHSKLEQVSQDLQSDSVDSKELGKLGETYAALRLMQQGWHVIDRNWHSRQGELDLVMITPEQKLVFVEVKTRRSVQYGTPLEAINQDKRNKLRKAGMQWIEKFGTDIPRYRIRFDAVSILVINKYTYSDSACMIQALEEIDNNSNIQFTHIPGAF
ncbi:YraN family protein [Gardnerella sp. c31Ua_26]|nr:YraN family protein [Gardnerella greenwoodii]MDF0753273.1 YraN family protein [Gardnerella greenwoodii]